MHQRPATGRFQLQPRRRLKKDPPNKGWRDWRHLTFFDPVLSAAYKPEWRDSRQHPGGPAKHGQLVCFIFERKDRVDIDRNSFGCGQCRGEFCRHAVVLREPGFGGGTVATGLELQQRFGKLR